MTEETIFARALEKSSKAERAAFLEQACAGDKALRRRVEALLESHEEREFLRTPAVERAAIALGRVATLEMPAPATIDDRTGTERPGTAIGPYKLLQKIGEGGMGTVFMAEQTEPVRRTVALKLVKAGMDTRQVLARFGAERQALALMDHPNIARVLEAGVTETGRPYFVMELVKGVPITRFCDERRLTPRERLELFIPVCQAIQHAHQKGIIHRDLKPSNVLVALYDGQPVPKIIDFGVAKATGARLTEATLFTGFGTVVGTPEYMSPEQAELNQLDIDTRSDIYSLGVVLFELLTGSTPLQHRGRKQTALFEVLRLIREEEPPKPSTRLGTTEELPAIAANRNIEPRRLMGLVRGELDCIVMKALEKDRNRRYETANDFAQDVQRYLRDEPVQACPPSVPYRCRKFARRNKGVVTTASVVLMAVLLAAGSLAGAVSALAARNAEVRAEQKQTKDALDREKETNDALARALASEERTRYYRSIALAERALTAGNVGRAEELLDECPLHLHGWEWHHLKRRPYGPITFRGHDTGAWTMAFSPDGNLIASAGAKPPFGEILVWDRRTGAVRLRRLAHLGPIEGLAFSPDGKRLATAGWDKTVKLWDAATGEELHTLRGHAEYVRCVAFSRDGKFLASAGRDHTILVWDAATYQKLRGLNGHTEGMLALAFGNDGRLASASSDGTVRVWDAATGEENQVLRGHAGPALAVAFLRDGTRLASGGFDGTARVWDPETGRQLLNLPIDTVAITCVAFNTSGTRLAAGSLEKAVRIWDLETGQEAVTLTRHADTVMAVAFSPDGQQLASASLDRTVQVWDASPATTGPRAIPLRGHGGAVFGVAFQPGGATSTLLASASHDATIKLWDGTTGDMLRTLTGHSGPVSRVFFSRDGRRMVSADFAGVAKIWDTATFKVIRTFPTFAGVVALSPNGRLFAGTGDGGILYVRDVESAVEVVPPIRAHETPIVTAAFSPDGKHLATGSWDGTVKTWEASTGRAVRTYAGNGVITWLAFSDDGTRLATSNWDKTVNLWDNDTGKKLHSLRGHEHRVVGVAFSPDGRRLATASQDSTARIWDVATGKEVAVLHGHIGYVLSVAFSADGKRLASSGGYRMKGDVRIWDTSQWDNPPEGK